MIDIKLLNTNVKDKIDFNEKIIYDNEYLKDSNILSITPIEVKGEVTKNSLNQLHLIFKAVGLMNLPCSITLEPVKYPINLDFDEIIDENDENKLKKDSNTLELKEYLWENIVVEIPLRIISEHAYDKEYKGNGWKLITDEDKKQNENKSFEVLKQLLDKE